MIIDTHAHYDDSAFDEDREGLIASLPSYGVGAVINAAASWDSLEKVRALCGNYGPAGRAEALPAQAPEENGGAGTGPRAGCVRFYGAYGIHPDEVGCFSGAPADDENAPSPADRMEILRMYCRLPDAVAVGEIGLDYHWMTESKETQEKWFRAQIGLAREEGLPVVVHSREAAEDTLRVCRDEDLGAVGGVMHCFPYGKELAREYLNMGLFLGIGGVVTFRNGRRMKEVVRYAPLSQLLLETDCPYLAPEPHRGRRNSSAYLPLVVSAIAELKGIRGEEVIRVTEENARRLFSLRTEQDP